MKWVFAILAAVCVLLGAYQVYIEEYMASPAGVVGKEVAPDRMENIRPVSTPGI